LLLGSCAVQLMCTVVGRAQSAFGRARGGEKRPATQKWKHQGIGTEPVERTL